MRKWYLLAALLVLGLAVTAGQALVGDTKPAAPAAEPKVAVSRIDKGGLNGDTVITLAKYVMEQRGDKTKELVDLQQKLDTLKEQTDFARRKLQELTAGTSKMERDAVVVVDRANGGGGSVRLNYLVDAASWHPHYKLRAGKPDEPVQIDYLAALVQQTGEDWSHVELT